MVLRNDQWERIAPLVPGKVGDPGRSGADNRLFVEAVLWIVRVGAPWRDLPQDFGNWNSVFQRFRRWVRSGVFDQMFEALSADADFEYVIVDGTINISGAAWGGGVKTRWRCNIGSERFKFCTFYGCSTSRVNVLDTPSCSQHPLCDRLETTRKMRADGRSGNG